MKIPAIVTALALAAASPCMAQTGFYLGQILTLPFNFCPTGTLPTNGQILTISSNAALFSLLGTQYGGDGTTTFALPNLKAPLAANRWPLVSCITTVGIFPSRN